MSPAAFVGSIALRIFTAAKESLEHEPAADILERAQAATLHLAALEIRKLAGEETEDLQAAVRSSFANLRAEGAIELADAIRDALRDQVDGALRDLVGIV